MKRRTAIKIAKRRIWYGEKRWRAATVARAMAAFVSLRRMGTLLPSWPQEKLSTAAWCKLGD